MSKAISSLLLKTSSRHQPWQIALAISLGVLAGLLPKLNLTFCLVGLVCYALPIHLPLATATCILVSLTVHWLVAPAFAIAAGRLGLWSLTDPLLGDLWMRLDAMPLVPWFRLHNTVTHGSWLIGSACLVPVFLGCHALARHLELDGSPIACQSRRSAALADPAFEQELIPVVSIVSSELILYPQLPIASVESILLVAEQRRYVPRIEFAANEETHAVQLVQRELERELERLLASCQDAEPHANSNYGKKPQGEDTYGEERYGNGPYAAEPYTEESLEMNAERVARRAGQMVELVDELLASELLASQHAQQAETIDSQPPWLDDSPIAEFFENAADSVIFQSESSVDAADDTPVSAQVSETKIRSSGASYLDTQIEITRRLEPAPSNPRTNEEVHRMQSTFASEQSPAREYSATASSQVQLIKAHDTHAAQFGRSLSAVDAPTRRIVPEVPKEEALRYLLHHLKAIRDKV